MRGIRFAVAGLLAAGMLAVVQAQPGGGFGGFGGGGPTGLVNQKAVHEDIKASEEQVKKLADWSKEFGAKRFEMLKDEGIDFKSGFGKGGFDEETRTKMAAANAKINKEAYKQLGDVLKKEQIERIKQIERQQMGLNAFTNAEVVETLKLTDTQKTTIKGIVGDYDKERREIFADAGIGGGKGKGGKGDPEKAKEATAKVQKAQTGYTMKIMEALDDSQKKTWKELTGEPFDLTKLTFGGFGGKGKKKD
jgi:hypothetical protein